MAGTLPLRSPWSQSPHASRCRVRRQALLEDLRREELDFGTWSASGSARYARCDTVHETLYFVRKGAVE